MGTRQCDGDDNDGDDDDYGENLPIPKHRTERYKKAFITQLLRNGILRLETYVSCQQ